MDRSLSSRMQSALSAWPVVIVLLFVMLGGVNHRAFGAGKAVVHQASLRAARNPGGPRMAGIKAKVNPAVPTAAMPVLLAFVANENSNNISVIDIATNTVVNLIPVGIQPVAAALTPDRSRLYVANFGDATVSVVDTAANAVTATIPVGIEPVGVAITPDGSKAYVANHASSSISVIDIATNTVVATVLTGNPPPALGSAPSSVVVSPDGTKVYAANFNLNTVSVIDAATNTILTTIAVGGGPIALAITQDGGSVYVANFGASSVTVIATATNSVSGSISVGTDPSGVAVTPDGATVYVTNKVENSVSVIAAATNVVTTTVAVDTNPVGIAMAPDGATVYAANFGSNTVSAIAVATNTVTGAIAVGAGPFGIAIPGALPPGIIKSFGAARIALDGTTTLSFTLTNSNITARLAGIAFTDNLPAGLAVASPGDLTNTCGGSAAATDGSSSVNLSGVTLAAGASCTVSVNVTGNTAGVKNNSVTVTSAEGGTGNTSNAILTVVAPPAMAESFGAASIPLTGTTSLSFTLNNLNSTDTLTGIGFSDTLPSGLVISTPSGQTGACGGGTITATQGTNVISLTGASLPANGSCSFSLNVTGIAAGTQNNATSSVISTEGGRGGTAFAAIVVVAPPALAQAFNPANIALNAASSLTFTITNPTANSVALTGVAFTDTLPAGLTVAGASSTVCGGTLITTAPAGITLSGATIAVSGQCQFSVTVTGAASGLHTNTTGNVTSANGGTGNAATASLTVASAPNITKLFGAATVPLNGTTSLTFTISNPNSGTALTGLAFTDSLPAGLVVAATPNLTSTCGGTAAAAGGSGSVSLSAGTLAAGASCTVSVDVTGTTAGIKNNSVTATSVEGGPGNTSNASLAVAAAPSILEAFGAAGVPLNGITSLTFSINNPNTGLALTSLAFTDGLPAGLVVASTPSLTNTCGGTATAVGGSSSVSLSGGTVAAGGSCTLSVNVTGTTVGVKNNSVSVTSAEGGAGNTSNASITVNGPPVISKAFGAASIPLNGSTLLSFTINNPSATSTLNGIGFTDTLPAGLVISTPNGLSGSCGGGTITATPAANVISLTGASLAAGASCSFSVNVKGTAAGTQNNTTGNVTSTEGGTGGTASASIAVIAPPSIAKAFTPSAIALNAATSLTFTITNPAANAVALTGVAFTDTLPTGLTVANASATVCGGTLSTTASTGISLSGASIAANSQCQFSVTVTGTASGQYTNTTGNVTSTNGGAGNTATAILTVATPPAISKIFGALSIPLNSTTTLTFSINNPNTNVILTGLAFTDSLPAGLVIATTPSLNNTCGGTATAAAGTSSVSLSGGTLAASALCTVSVNITGTTAGVKNNSVQVSSTEGGNGNTSNASVTVIAPPVIGKAFGAAGIPLNGSTSLSFTIQNNNTTTTLTGIGFSDTLPAGLVVSTPNGLSGSCGGGTITAPQAANIISLTGASLAAGGSCSFSVNVTGTAAGTQNNTTGNVTSTEGGTGGTASASIAVVGPPVIAKAFNPAGIPLNATTSLTFTISNPNSGMALTGLAFSDSLPAGLVVAATPNLSNTCGGTATAVGGSSSLSLSGGTMAANTSCTLSVNVTGTTVGVKNNSVSVTSTEGGTGNTSNASMTVNSPPVTTTSFAAADIPLNGTTTLTFSLTNPNTGTALTGIAFTDNLPAGLTVAPAPNLNNTCGGTFTAAAGAGQVSLSGVTLPASASCAASVDVQGTAAGVKNNSVTVTSTEGGTGITSNASVTVVSGLRFVPVAPCRIADTRNATGPFGGPFLSGQTTRGFTIPQSACGIPAAAQAYSLNVTVVPHGALGFLTMFPCGQSLPLASTLNSLDGRIKAVAAIVPAGTNGAVCAFPTNDTDLVLDINGYFVPATDASALDFYPVTPCRLVDTRLASGPLGGPSLVGNSTRTFPVLSSSCSIPPGAKAYSLNYTSVPKGPLGFLTTWPSPQTQPLVSTLNALTGAITANAAIVPAGINGDISVFVTNASDLVIDINGYFAAPAPGGLSLFNVAPCRVLDTRSPTPTGGQPFTSVDLNVTTAGCGVPATAQSYVLNATVVPPGPLGFLTLWPQGAPQPLVSTLNAVDGAITSNMAIVPTANGSISAFASNSTHLVLDISGYFAPSQPAGFGPVGSRTAIPAGLATVGPEIPSTPAMSPPVAPPLNENVFSIFLTGVDPASALAVSTFLPARNTRFEKKSRRDE